MKLKSLPFHPVCCFAITRKTKKQRKAALKVFYIKSSVLPSVHGLS